MIDFPLNAPATISTYLENVGLPILGANVTVTVRNPLNVEIVTNAPTVEEGGGWYRYVIDESLMDVAGLYRVTWTAVVGSDTIVDTSQFVAGPLPPNPITLLHLRHTIARNLGDLTTGRATSGTTTTIIDPRRIEPDDHWVGADCYVYAGTNAGTPPVKVTMSVQSTTTLYLSPALPDPVNDTTTYELHLKFRKEDYDEAIRQALFDLQGYTFVHVHDASQRFDSGVVQYPIPEGFAGLYRVDVEVFENDWRTISPTEWRVLQSTRQVEFRAHVPILYSTYRFRLHGLMGLNPPLHEGSLITINPAFLIAKAKSILVNQEFTATNLDFDDIRGQKTLYEQEAQLLRQRLRTPIPPNWRPCL